MVGKYSFKWWELDISIENEKGESIASFKPTYLQGNGHERQAGSPNASTDSFSSGVLLYGLYDQSIERDDVVPKDADLDGIEAGLRHLIQQAEAAVRKIPKWREYARRHPEVFIGHTDYSAFAVRVPIDRGQVLVVRNDEPEVPDIVKERVASILSELKEIGTLEWVHLQNKGERG